LLVHRAEVFPVYVGVDLRGGEIRVAQHLLHGPEIGPTFQQVSSKAVSKGVRSHSLSDAGPLSGSLHNAPGTYPGEH
jgi:hypothetical protein